MNFSFEIKSNTFLFFVIAVIGTIVYSNTFHVPYYMDDLRNIVENSAIRDVGQASRNIFSSSRCLVYLTFALNYRFGGLDVAGYHIVNLVIHIFTSFLVLLVLKRIFRQSSWLHLLGALLFLVHPLQTQAVTYIVQRMTSFAGLFFFLSLYLYVRAREEHVTSEKAFSLRHGLYYFAALLSGAIAVHVKQNAAILPLALLLFDHYFLPQAKSSFKKRLFYFLPFLLAPMWVSVQELILPLAQGTGLQELARPQNLVSQRQLTPINYLVTEFSVIWLYIRLLFLPFGQTLDYSYPVVENLVAWKNLFAFLGIAGLLGSAFFCRRKAPLISFGIIWFFLALSVESTFLPLDPAFEHRLYVPMFGFVLAVIGLLQLLSPPRLVPVVLLLLIAFFAITAWNRNTLWNDPVAFFEDNLRRVPWSERVNVFLAKSYRESGRTDDALRVLLRANQINPGFDLVCTNLSVIYIEKGDYDLAMATLKKGLEVNPGAVKLYDNIGSLYEKLGQHELAIQYLERAINIDPLYYHAYLNLGGVYAKLGQLSKASEYYQKAITLSKDDPLAHYFLGVMYYWQNRIHEAYREFKLASEKNPLDGDALFNLSIVRLELGERQAAIEALPRLKQLNGTLAEKLKKELADRQ